MASPLPLDHRCHALACEAPVRPSMLMCYRHWRMVPARLRRDVLASYRKGQEFGLRRLTAAWREAAKAAIVAVSEKEDVA